MNNTFLKYFTLITIITFNINCSNQKDKETEQFLIRGNLAMSKFEYDKAMHFYNEAIEKTKDYAPAYNNRGLLKVQIGDLDGAITDFEKAISLEPDFKEAIYNLGNYLGEKGEYDKGLNYLKQVENTYKDSSFYHTSLGFIHTNQNNFSQAYADFQKAIMLNPKNDKAYSNLGFVQIQEKKYTDAKINFEKALQQNPKQDMALNNLSFIYSRDENYAKALELINKALEQKPVDPLYQNNKGYILLMQNELEEGKKLIENSINQSKNKNPWAYRNLGIYYLKINNLKQSLDNLQLAESLDPSVELIYYYLGLAQKANKNPKKACEYWQKGSKLKDSKSTQMLSECSKM